MIDLAVYTGDRHIACLHRKLTGSSLRSIPVQIVNKMDRDIRKLLDLRQFSPVIDDRLHLLAKFLILTGRDLQQVSFVGHNPAQLLFWQTLQCLIHGLYIRIHQMDLTKML